MSSGKHVAQLRSPVQYDTDAFFSELAGDTPPKGGGWTWGGGMVSYTQSLSSAALLRLHFLYPSPKAPMTAHHEVQGAAFISDLHSGISVSQFFVSSNAEGCDTRSKHTGILAIRLMRMSFPCALYRARPYSTWHQPPICCQQVPSAHLSQSHSRHPDAH